MAFGDEVEKARSILKEALTPEDNDYVSDHDFSP